VLGVWSPLSPNAVRRLLAPVIAPWWIAGGWAIDLHVGHQTREHADTDVLVLRRDLPAVVSALAGWDLHFADGKGGLVPWPSDVTLPDAAHDIWCRPRPAEPWALQLMVDEAEGDDWLYRRDHGVRRPQGELDGPSSATGMRVLAPEVQLLYKSTNARDKDQRDFTAVLPALDAGTRAWLRGALETTDPRHEWIDTLRIGA